MVFVIGLSPCIGTQVSAMWQPQVKPVKVDDLSKEELLRFIPNLWQDFWSVWDAKEAAYGAARVHRISFFKNAAPWRAVRFAAGEDSARAADFAVDSATYGVSKVNGKRSAGCGRRHSGNHIYNLR